jgi:hypothetical protein
MTKFWICTGPGGFALALSVANATLAAPLTLPFDAQASFREAVSSDYSKQMARAGAYDEIKERRIKPKLRILDCFGERCLLDIVTSPNAPGFDSMLYLVTIRDNALVGEMKGISPYGHATDNAAFVAFGGSKTPTAIYVTSHTHMGTYAEQIIDMNDQSKQIAFESFYDKKLQDKEGAIKYLAKAQQALRKIGNPFEF